MSVLVKGMEMPKNCAYCPLSEYRNSSLGQILDCKRIGTVGSAVRGTHDVLNHRHPNCPLVDSPEPHWIPVTERLPENNDPVNVTWVNRKPEFYYSEIKDKPYTATAIYFRGKWFWYSCVIEDWLAEYGSNESFLANLQEAVDRDIEITAWMPLPEPYKGVTE